MCKGRLREWVAQHAWPPPSEAVIALSILFLAVEIVHSREGPFKQATITSNTYWDWFIDHAWILYPLSDVVGEFMATFKEYPPRMKAVSFTIGDALNKLQPTAK